MNLFYIIEQIALRYAKNHQLIQAGNNGPYFDNEKKFRNQCHWIIIFSKLYRSTGNKNYLKSVQDLSKIFFLKEARPHGYSFHHRNKVGKDSSNGLVGQAWSFEALYECYITLNDKKFQLLAEEVYNLHKFDHQNGLWYTLDINGKNTEIDAAFNHQLWFAYSAAQIIPNSNPNFSNILCFLDKILENLTVLENGLIFHPIERYAIANLLKTNKSFFEKTKGKIKSIIRNKSFDTIFQNKKSILEKRERKNLEKSYGYHAFNLFAFVKLEKIIPQHLFWKSSSYKKIFEIIFEDNFMRKNRENIYSFPYNPVGFELAYVIYEKYNDSSELISFMINKQFELHFDFKSLMFSKNNNDTNTLTARLYELLSIPNDTLSRVEIS